MKGEMEDNIGQGGAEGGFGRGGVESDAGSGGGEHRWDGEEGGQMFGGVDDDLWQKGCEVWCGAALLNGDLQQSEVEADLGTGGEDGTCLWCSGNKPLGFSFEATVTKLMIHR